MEGVQIQKSTNTEGSTVNESVARARKGGCALTESERRMYAA